MTRSRLFPLHISFIFQFDKGGGRPRPLARGVVCGVEQLTDTNRAFAVAAAAAHDLNNELTVIVNSVTCALGTVDAEHPAHQLLLDLRASAQRCAWKASGLLNYSARVNPSPVRASFEFLIAP
jgi:hypothetical protein